MALAYSPGHSHFNDYLVLVDPPPTSRRSYLQCMEGELNGYGTTGHDRVKQS